jgi:hypothetical protein
LVLPEVTGGLGEGELTEQIRFRLRLDRLKLHLGPQLLQPEQQPAALKAFVACQHDAATFYRRRHRASPSMRSITSCSSKKKPH